VPPAAGGFAPKLSIDYDGGSGASEVGLGFRISGLPGIRRRTSAGLPKFDASDAFELVGLGMPCDLLAMPDGFYRPQYETGSFARVQRSPDGATWEVRTKEGTTFRFGGVGFTEEENGNVATYLLREAVDLHGHRIVYAWDTSSGHALLESVVWNDFSKNVQQRIEVTYEPRPDVHTLFSSGIRRVLGQRVKAIEVTLGGDLVRRYTLGYAPGNRSLLASVDMVGTDGVTALPQLTLSYTEPSFATEGQVQRMGFPPYPTPADPNVSLADLNGDGLPDLLVAQAGQFHTYVNHDGLTWKPANDWGPSTSPSLSLSTTGVGLADLDGDGAVDLFAKSGADSFRYFPGKDATRFNAPVSIRTVPNFTFEDPDVRVVDMDGDRLPDVAITTKAGLAIGYNLGGVDWSLPALVGKIDTRQELRFSDGKTELCDINGDHLQDICYLTPGSLAYWLGRGRGLFEAGEQATGVPVFDVSDPWKLVDLNGDGWVDLVHVGVTQVEYALATAEGVFGVLASVKSTPAKGPNVNVQFADMNGSGTTDILWVERTQNEGTYWRYLELFPEGRAGLLKTIENGLGKRTTITYSSAAAYAAAARDAGTPWTSRINLDMPVVAKVQVDAQLGDPALTTGYAYANGAWDPGERTFAGFAGGTQTELGDAYTPTLITESTFDLGIEHRVLRGAVLTTEQRDTSRRVFSRSTSTYRLKTLGKARDGRAVEYAYKNDELLEHVEGADESAVRLTEKSWEQDEFGNLVSESDWGEVTRDDLSVGNDEAITLRTFANNVDEWVLGRLATEEVTDIEGTRTAMKRFYYDGAPFEGLPLGQATRGDLMRTDSWIEKQRFAGEDRNAFDTDGNLVTILTARGERREFDYDPSRTLLKSERRSNGTTTLAWIAEQDPRFGKLLELTTPNTAHFSFRYDALGRITDVVKPGDSLELPTEHFEYEFGAPLSHVLTSQREVSGSNGTLVSTALTDGLGRTRGVLRAAENGQWELTQFGTFDARGQLAFSAFPSFEAKPRLPVLKGRDGETHWRDALGREIGTEHLDGSSTRTAYAPLTRTFWDENDNDPRSEHFDTPTRYESDGRGRLVAVVEREAKDEFATRYTYDAVGNLLSFQDAAGTVHTYAYDGRSRRIAISDPNAGNWQFVFTDGNDLERRIDPTLGVVRYAYDAFGRVTEEWHRAFDSREEVLAARYHYDRASDAHPELAAHLNGNLAWVEDRAGSAFFGYDARARRIKNVRDWSDGSEHVTASNFDAADRQVERRFPDDSVLYYAYNSRGLLASVGPIVTEVVWSAAANVESLTLGNGVVDARSYDRRLRLERLSALTASGEIVRDLKYTLDAASRITDVADLRPGIANDRSASASFRFDDRYRLLEMKDARGVTSFVYDAVAKIQSIQSDRDDPNLNLTNTYAEEGAGTDQLTHHGTEALSYDAAGRVIADGTRKLTWDAKGRLARVERGDIVEEYTYAFDDTRAIKRTTTKAGTKTVKYIGGDVELRDGKLVRYVTVGNERIARLDSVDSASQQSAAPSKRAQLTSHAQGLRAALGSSSLVLALVVLAATLRRAGSRPHGPRGSVAVVLPFVLLALSVFLGCSSAAESGAPIREAPASTVYFLNDRQGSPTVTLAADGTVLSSASYLPYGADKQLDGARADSRRFLGNEHDEGADLGDFQARPYRPDAGIFLAPDPLPVFEPEAGISEPARLYPYAYVGGDPINRADPNGKTFGEYVSGIFDEARDQLVDAVHAQVNRAVGEVKALAEGRVGDFLHSRAEATLALIETPIHVAKDVANFPHDFAEAAFTPNDYDMGRKAVKPIMTAMTVTSLVAGAKDALSSTGCPCFAAETLVGTAQGLRPISEIHVGDLVLARDPDSGATEYRPVLQVFITPDKPLVELTLRDQAGGTETLLATPGHPFWVDGNGWTLAQDLALGVHVSTADRGRLEIVGAASAHDAQAVYNLEVEGFHTYFVGRSEAWVHNACKCTGATPTGRGNLEHAPSFDQARERAFRYAGMEDPANVRFGKEDATGTIVEFKGPNGAKVVYDGPHADMDPAKGHDKPHVGWQSGGKQPLGGARGNITYDGPAGPARSDVKE
jgi:RHS repeat-associated protein